MIDKLLCEYKKKYKSKYQPKTKSHSLSKKNKIQESNLSETKIKHKQINKNIHQRNILFSNKQSKINLKSTSTSSLSSSAEKKYLTPTKYNLQNCENDYYFNQSYNKTQELFNIANISLPKFNYKSGHKKVKNILTIGTRLNTINNNTFNINSNYGKTKAFVINRSYKGSKNKYVICRKNNFLNNSKAKEDKYIESKSVENYHNINNKNKNENDLCKYLNLENCFNDYDYNTINSNCNYTAIKQKKFLNEENSENNENKSNINNIKSYNKERKFKNIVLRPRGIQKQNEIKHNLKVNNYEIDDSPKIINKIMTRLNIKPKYSRVFKYK